MSFIALQVGGGNYLLLQVTPATPPGAPGAPLNLTAVALSDTIIGLAWDRADDTDTSLQIYRQAGGSGPFVLHDTTPARENLYNDRSCDPATAYAYYVVAVNGSGSSPASGTASATTPASGATLGAMTGVSASAPNAWSVTVSYTDPGDGGSHRLVLERSTGGAFAAVKVLVGVGGGGAGSWTDGVFNGPLAPGTAYTYRIRQYNANGYGPFAYAGATTPARTAGAPPEPTGLTAVPSSDVLTVLSLTDHSGGAAQHVIETAPVSGTGTPETSTFSTLTTLAAGVTTFNMTTLARHGYYVRAHALQSGLVSGNTPTLLLTTPSTPNAGGPQTYHVGPGQTYADVAAFAAGAWASVGPGDTVFLHCNLDGGGAVVPWFNKVLLPWRGTAAAPIRFVGVNDPATGVRPIIDGTNATTPSQFVSGSGGGLYGFEDLSLLLVGALPTDGNGFFPGYLSIENLEVRNGYQGDFGTGANTYTAHDGSSRFYGGASISGSGSGSGVYLSKGNDLTVKGCVIHGNGNGIFGSDGSSLGTGDTRRLANVLIDTNYIYGNSTAGDGNGRQHNSYLEARGAIYQGNRYGPLRAGAVGGCIKDRSDGAVIRYNELDGGAGRIDLVEAQNHEWAALESPNYRKSFVYGNRITNQSNPSGVSAFVDYGGDTAGDWLYRSGICYLAYNTFVVYSNQTSKSTIKLLQVKTGGAGPGLSSCFDLRNNVVYVGSPDAGAATLLYVLDKNGLARFGSGWVSPGFTNNATGGGNATVAGVGHLLNAAGNTPAFVDLAGGDDRPTPSSPFLGSAIPLAGSMPGPVDREYVLHQALQARAAITDMGYNQQGT